MFSLALLEPDCARIFMKQCFCSSLTCTCKTTTVTNSGESIREMCAGRGGTQHWKSNPSSSSVLGRPHKNTRVSRWKVGGHGLKVELSGAAEEAARARFDPRCATCGAGRMGWEEGCLLAAFQAQCDSTLVCQLSYIICMSPFTVK